MQMKSLFLMIALFFSQLASASIITPDAETRRVSGVDVAESITVNTADHKDELYLLGAGLRKKKVALVFVKVYVAALYSSQPELFLRAGDTAASSINDMNSTSMVLTFKRNIDAVTLKNAFVKALAVNKVDTKQAHIKALMNAVLKAYPAIKGKTYAFYGVKLNNAEEKIVFEDSAGKTAEVVGPTGFIKDVMSMWIGKVDNAQVQKLKDQIISGK